jgi:hypothetical protein
MNIVIVIVLVYAFVALVEVPGLIRKKYRRELAAFSFFMIAAFLLNSLQALGVKIPSPITGIVYIIKDVLHINY